MTLLFFYCLSLLLLALLLAPIVHFLFVGWRLKYNEIGESFDKASIEAYFARFHPSVDRGPGFDAKEMFGSYLHRNYGWWNFVTPLILLFFVAGVSLAWSGATVMQWVSFQLEIPALPELAVLALLGAYMWVLSELIAKNKALWLFPSDVYWGGFRFAVAVPMAYAFASVFDEALAGAVAFLLGAFPTRVILEFSRKVLGDKIGIGGEEPEGSELLDLQGMDRRACRLFSQQGTTTNLQLAYCDPIQLSVRTGLSFVFVMDCVSQALLWIYVEDKLANLRKFGQRGAQEVCNLQTYLESDDEATSEEAEAIVQALATELEIESVVLEGVIYEVAKDPQTTFLHSLWKDTSVEPEGEDQDD